MSCFMQLEPAVLVHFSEPDGAGSRAATGMLRVLVVPGILEGAGRGAAIGKFCLGPVGSIGAADVRRETKDRLLGAALLSRPPRRPI